MSERVKLPRKASEALDSLRAEGKSNFIIVDMFINDLHYHDPRTKALNMIPSFDTLLNALIFGHEPEASKEDIIRRNYKYGNMAYREAVLDTLEVYEIIVPGVNDQ